MTEDTLEKPIASNQAEDKQPDGSRENPGFDTWMELVIAVLLAIATVATAWSGYQASRWGGVQSTLYNQAGAKRQESVRASNEANSLRNIDVFLYAEWVKFTISDQTELANYYEARFRQEFRPAFDAWRATDPFNNPDAPSGPFAMPEYVLAAQIESEALVEEAALLFDEGGAANQQSDDYILNTVILASVLFLSGIANRIVWRPARLMIVVLTMGMLAIGLYNAATYPIA